MVTDEHEDDGQGGVDDDHHVAWGVGGVARPGGGRGGATYTGFGRAPPGAYINFISIYVKLIKGSCATHSQSTFYMKRKFYPGML